MNSECYEEQQEGQFQSGEEIERLPEIGDKLNRILKQARPSISTSVICHLR